jgi:OPA family sugar phosphate sensor protein UhpC-like MFS transporter
MAEPALVAPPDTSALRVWRWRVFAATWLCYAGFYFARKPFSIVKSAMGKELALDASALGVLGAGYLVAYTIGQFVAGWAGHRAGARALLLVGMGVSAAASVGLGLTNSYGLLLALMVCNGLAQATGWSGNVATMANWFARSERGRVMGVWATNFQAGGVMANTLAAWALGAWGWRYSFFSGAVVLLAVQAFFAFNQRNRPEDLGLPAVEDDAGETADGSARWTRAVVTNVLLVGVFYFFVKFIRYALWSWAPFFLERNFGIAGDDAGYLSTVFDVAGVFGVVVTGFLSDRVFASRRAGVSLLMMLAMTVACFALWQVGRVSVPVFAVCIGVVGFTLYGPDALMTGAGAMDIGSRRGAALAAGIINGMGSVGSVVQELVIGKMYDSSAGDLGPILVVLLGASAAAAAVMGVVVTRNRMGISDV